MEFSYRTANSHSRRSDAIRRWMESDTAKASRLKRVNSTRIKFENGAMLLAAVSSGDIEETESLINDGADVNYSNIDGLTPLHQACIEENMEMVELLVKNGAIIDCCDNEGWTPLHAVASTPRLDIIKFLMARGANVGAVNTDGELPFDLTDDPAVRNFLETEMKAKNISMEESRSIEHKLLVKDSLRWQQQGFVEDVRDVQGATALHVASAKGYMDVMRILLAVGVDINCTDYDGWTPLHAAIYWKQQEACQNLLEAGADINVRNNSGQTPLDLADEEISPFVKGLIRRFKIPEAGSSDRPGLSPARTSQRRQPGSVDTLRGKVGRDKPLVGIMKISKPNSVVNDGDRTEPSQKPQQGAGDSAAGVGTVPPIQNHSTVAKPPIVVARPPMKHSVQGGDNATRSSAVSTLLSMPARPPTLISSSNTIKVAAPADTPTLKDREVAKKEAVGLSIKSTGDLCSASAKVPPHISGNEKGLSILGPPRPGGAAKSNPSSNTNPSTPPATVGAALTEGGPAGSLLKDISRPPITAASAFSIPRPQKAQVPETIATPKQNTESAAPKHNVSAQKTDLSTSGTENKPTIVARGVSSTENKNNIELQLSEALLQIKSLKEELSAAIKKRDELERSLQLLENEYKNHNKIVEENKRLSQENNSLIKVLSSYNSRTSSSRSDRGAS